MLSVSADCTSNKVRLTFSEPVSPASATTAANYAIDHGVVVLNALLGPPNTVCLFTTPLTFGTTYTITINGVRDLCGNVIADNTQIRFSCPTNGSLSGQKFNDLNGNGVWDADEPALAGWTIHLSNGQTATTDASSYYYFLNLLPGSYTVSEVQQSGWVQTVPAGGFYSVVLGQSQATNGLNFGNYTNCCDPPWNPTNCCTNCTAPYLITSSVTVLPGWNFLVNPLCHGTNNTVGELLPNVPDRTELMKWNVASQAYDPAITFDSGFGGWVDQNLRLEPGEGVFYSRIRPLPIRSPSWAARLTWLANRVARPMYGGCAANSARGKAKPIGGTSSAARPSVAPSCASGTV